MGTHFSSRVQVGISDAGLLQQRGPGRERAPALRHAEAAFSPAGLAARTRVIAELIVTDNILKPAGGSKR